MKKLDPLLLPCEELCGELYAQPRPPLDPMPAEAEPEPEKPERGPGWCYCCSRDFGTAERRRAHAKSHDLKPSLRRFYDGKCNQKAGRSGLGGIVIPPSVEE